LDLSSERNAAAAARALRQHWGIGERPIGHMVKLLETKGIRVFSLAENTKNVDAFSCWRDSEPYIFLNTFKTPERSRFDAAHELGHLVLHKHGGPQQGRQAELEAQTFASHFLMPPADLLANLPYATSLKHLLSAKKRWGVSLSALAYSMHKHGRITDWNYRTFCIQITRNYGKSEPDGLPPERSSVWQMVLSELWKDGVSRNQLASELKLPFLEVENLLFGLTGDVTPPARASGRAELRAVK
jgi:Zn-dependent peptidase ImmA (M78 family)